MADEATEARHVAPGAGPLKITGVSQCPVVYANVGTIVNTPFDMQFVFGELKEMTPAGAMAQANVRVIVTPELAEVVLRALAQRLQAYTLRHGQLRNMGVELGEEVPFLEHPGTLEDASQK
jgi:hypothetical protein